jgi:fermentation-respiration switch protein FrsA (DUF1100 family)
MKEYTSPVPKPPRERPPLPLRVAFSATMLTTLLLVCVRVLNAVSVYPPLEKDRSLAPALAAGRDDVREVRFVTADGVSLYGWVLGPDARPRKIIAFTGNGDYVGSIAGLYAEHAQALDAQFLLFDYRGYANSEGRPSEAGLYADARAAYDFATQELQWPPARISLWGRSLGGGPAIKLAHELVGKGTPPAALVLEAPFTSIADMARVAMPMLGKPEWLIYESYDNIGRVPALTMPVFHCQGTADEVIPYEQGERLYAALPRPKEHVSLEGAGHLDIWDNAARAAMIRARSDAFLRMIVFY